MIREVVEKGEVENAVMTAEAVAVAEKEEVAAVPVIAEAVVVAAVDSAVETTEEVNELIAHQC